MDLSGDAWQHQGHSVSLPVPSVSLLVILCDSSDPLLSRQSPLCVHSLLSEVPAALPCHPECHSGWQNLSAVHNGVLCQAAISDTRSEIARRWMPLSLERAARQEAFQRSLSYC